MVCPLVTRTLCHAARDRYIKYDLPKYVKILMDPEYQKEIKMTLSEAKQEVQKLTMMRIELHKYDEIDDYGKRVPKKKNIFGNIFDQRSGSK